MIRLTAVEDSTSLEKTAAKTSQDALLSEIRTELTNAVSDKARLADSRLTSYSNSLEYAMEWFQIQKDFFSNLETILKPVVDRHPSIASIYLETEDGFMLSYDTSSDIAGNNGQEIYWNYTETNWYQIAKTTKASAFTEVYQDSYGRGLTITCVAPLFGSLARLFNFMTDSLQKYITDLKKVTAREERIASELSVATKIQADMLPNDFPAFPDRKEFDLLASMSPAKEVDGDFCDFFMIDDNHLGLVMADVSGKGVPAALFMVVAKTLIKNRAQLGKGNPADILFDVNNQLCENNKEMLFVTVWLGILDIESGIMTCANAGHENLVLREADGVPEATRKDGALFGLERMVIALNKYKDGNMEELLKGV